MNPFFFISLEMIERMFAPYEYLVEVAVFSPKFRGGILIPGNVQYFFLLRTDGRIQERYLNHQLWIEAYNLMFPRNHKFYEAFDEKFQQLWTSGIIEFYSTDYKKFSSKKYYKKFRHLYVTDGPQVLTLKHLEAGFVICLVAIFFAFIAFVIEWAVIVRDFLVFTNIFETFIAIQNNRSKEIQDFLVTIKMNIAMPEADEANSQLSTQCDEESLTLTVNCDVQANSVNNDDNCFRIENLLEEEINSELQ